MLNYSSVSTVVTGDEGFSACKQVSLRPLAETMTMLTDIGCHVERLLSWRVLALRDQLLPHLTSGSCRISLERNYH